MSDRYMRWNNAGLVSSSLVTEVPVLYLKCALQFSVSSLMYNKHYNEKFPIITLRFLAGQETLDNFEYAQHISVTSLLYNKHYNSNFPIKRGRCTCTVAKRPQEHVIFSSEFSFISVVSHPIGCLLDRKSVV